MDKFIIFLDKVVKIVPSQHLPPIELPINYISDRGISDFYLPKELRGCELKWHKLWMHPRWKKNTIPIAVLRSARGNNRRRKILKMCKKASHPIILLYPDGGIPGYKICDENMYLHLGLRENVIIFTWSIEMTKEQKILLQYLLRHWSDIPMTAYSYLQNLDFIPNYTIPI
jgi:hypothetical protein